MNRRALLALLACLAAGCGSSSSAPPAVGEDSSTSLDVGSDDADAPGDSAIDTREDSSTIVDADAGPAALTCAWVNDANNCWRALVRQIDTCIPNGEIASSGTFNADDSTCSYLAGRLVTFTLPVDPFASTGDSADRDFTITNHTGATCMHYVEQAGATVGFRITGPDGGTFEMTTVHNDMTITCPDGTRYEGDTAQVTKICGLAAIGGGLPAHHVYEPGNGEARFDLNGEINYAYDCFVPGDGGPSDAGAGDTGP